MDLKSYIFDVARRFAKANICFGHGTDNPDDEAVYLVFGSLGIDFNISVEDANRGLSSAELDCLEDLVKQRITHHVPVAYLIGEAWFAGLKFLSDERALVPRSPIAELIMNRFRPLLEDAPLKILDLCTGSGCIGIAIAHYFERSEVHVSDNAENCLQLAKRNISFHNLSRRIKVIHSNLFENITDKYDLIITNPPYVSENEYENLPIEYSHEPYNGLVSGDLGLAVPRKILYAASEYLTETGQLIMEVGLSSQELIRSYPEVPFLWLEFDRGGEGVFRLTADQLTQYFRGLN